MKILLLTRYSALGASSRVRCYQYIPYLQAAGFSITTQPLFDDSYLQLLYAKQRRSFLQITKYYINRLITLIKANQFDCLWIEKELFPWLPPFAENLLQKLKIPYIVDYDDAIFHNYDLHAKNVVRQVLGRKIDQVMKNATLVIAGNDYLAQRAKAAGAKQVEIIPTIIDLNRYNESQNKNKVFTIGWIGNPATSPYLQLIQKPLARFSREHETRLVVVGDPNVKLEGINVEYCSWSETAEVSAIQQFDVGIMPLHDTPWEQGKCGYKLIQYMACGKPVIASPIGVNKTIVQENVNGFLAATDDEWYSAFRRLKMDSELGIKFGKQGRQNIEKEYCLQVTAPKLQNCFEQVMRAKTCVE